MRADGRTPLHIHARLVTPDGAAIAYFAEAVGSRKEGAPLLQVHENVLLHTAYDTYTWVNNLVAWSVRRDN